MIERRSILTGLVALVAAPAIVKVGQVMAINSGLVPRLTKQEIVGLALNQITRDAARLLKESNMWFDQDETARVINQISDYEFYNVRATRALMERQIEPQSGVEINTRYQANKIGDVLRIRLPNDYVITDGPSMPWHTLGRSEVDARFPLPVEALAPVALAAAALVAAPEILRTPVTRRFWSK